MRFLSRQHIRTGTDFLSIKKGGQRESVGAFALLLKVPSCSSCEIRRLGLVAARKVGNAVKRNRAKRILREIFRLNQNLLPESCDLLLIPYGNIDKYSFFELQERYRSAIGFALKKLNAKRS